MRSMRSSSAEIHRTRLKRAQSRGVADAPPKCGKRLAGSLSAADGQPVGEDRSIHRPRAGRANSLESQGLLFQKAVKHTPGEGAMRAAALKGQIYGLGRGARLISIFNSR